MLWIGRAAAQRLNDESARARLDSIGELPSIDDRFFSDEDVHGKADASDFAQCTAEYVKCLREVSMSTVHEGGCLCRDVRYQTTANPIWTAVCHCTFCQKITGSAFLVEPIFERASVIWSGAAPKTYEHRSDGSEMRVTLSFCGCCGTTLNLAFERFPGVLGVCGGTFDDPNWFDRGPDKCRHIFTRSAQRGVVLPAGVPTFIEHALRLDGTPNEAIVLAEPRCVSG